MPVVVMDEIRTNDVKISGSHATVFLSGTVEDAVADNLPPGYGDIASVTVRHIPYPREPDNRARLRAK
jgi:hypothetical protein